jgi:cell division protein FtsX
MFAILAAIIFALSLILDWADTKVSDAFTPQTLVTAGLLSIAVHLAGIGTSTSWLSRRRR